MAEKLNDIGWKIRVKRIEQKRSAHEFANDCNISRQYLYSIETGKIKKLNVELLKNICEVLECKIEDLF